MPYSPAALIIVVDDNDLCRSSSVRTYTSASRATYRQIRHALLRRSRTHTLPGLHEVALRGTRRICIAYTWVCTVVYRAR